MVALIGATSACRDLLAPDQTLSSDPQLSIAGILLGTTSIEVTPAGPLSLLPGDTLTLRGPRQSSVYQLAFASSDTTVVTASEQGLVTALRPGSARVTVAYRSDPRVAAVVFVQVASRGPSSIEIDSIQPIPADSAGPIPVLRPDSVAGSLLAKVRIQRGNAVRLEVMIDSVVACSTVLSRTATTPESKDLEAVRCEIDTARFDSISGMPLFRNGQAAVTGRLLDGRAEVLATSAPVQLHLMNRDTIAIRIVPDRRAVDSTGRDWLGGSLRIGAFPVVYSGTDRTSSVTFEYVTPAGTRLTAVDTQAPFVTTIEASALAGVVDEAMKIVATSAGPGGTRLLSGVLPASRYDAVPPPPGRVAGRDWVGANVQFASFHVPDGAPERGVGGTRVRFFAGSSSVGFAEILRSGTPVQRGADLPESAAGTYRTAYEVCDALLNCSTGDGFDFGVDLKAPTVVAINLPARVVGPAEDIRVQVSDERSGVTGTPLEVAVISYRPSIVPGPICGAALNDLILPGREVAGICYAEPTTENIPVPRLHEGYYVYRITAVDRAGNRANTIERVVLNDVEAPAIGRFTLPSQFAAGVESTFTAEVTDNMDLASVQFGLVFSGAPGSIELPFGGAFSVGTPFTGSLTRSFTASGRMPFVRSLTTVGPASRSTFLVDSARARAVDAAGLQRQSTLAIPASLIGGAAPSSDPFAAVTSIQLGAGALTLCTAGCGSSDGKSTTLTARITGSAGLSAFSRLYWFLRAADGTVTRIATSPNFSVVETGTQRTYTYTLPWTPEAGLVGRYRLFAVALNATGNALMSPEVALEIIAR